MTRDYIGYRLEGNQDTSALFLEETEKLQYTIGGKMIMIVQGINGFAILLKKSTLAGH